MPASKIKIYQTRIEAVDETGKTFEIGEFCHHRHEAHEARIAFDGVSYRCGKCGYYFNSKPKIDAGE